MSTDKKQLMYVLAASALSGVLIAASMPNFDIGFLGWIGLVPLLIALEFLPNKSAENLAIPFGVIWSLAVHNWYPSVMGPLIGYPLVLVVGWYYAMLIGWGVSLQRKLPAAFRLLALPIVWTAAEFVKYIAPIVKDWWFVWFANSQWRFPPALQVLTLGGLPSLSFILLLGNVALAALLLKFWREKKLDMGAAAALVVVALVVGWGALTIPAAPSNTFVMAATTDLSNQDPEIKKHSKIYSTIEGPYADTDEMSQAIFDVNAQLTREIANQNPAFIVWGENEFADADNAALTREIANQNPAFVVWGENEFADADDAAFTGQVGALAAELNAYIVTDMYWNASTGLHDTAVMMGPDGSEVGRRAKINMTSGEKEYGFVAGPLEFPIYDSPYGKVGIAVCWDRHALWVTRELAKRGAQIVLMPVDDDFNRNEWFPPFHAADGVFRAVENRVTLALGTTNGLSILVDPYGRILAEGGINERGVISAETFVVEGNTLYTKWGDWFGWLMVACALGMAWMVVRKKA